jgi:UDP-glucose 4-epimerase
MKVAVIGGSGFIGSHVVDKLVANRHDVTVMDIMRPHRADVTHYSVDITDPTKLNVALTGGYDAAYMLAAMANVNDVYRNPVESVQLNVQAVVNVLEACRRNAVKRFILASTVWVYEACEAEYPDESTPITLGSIQSLYTASKVSAEMACHAYQKLYGVNFTILRYGIPYGPRARSGTVIALFVNKAMNREPLTIQGTGQQKRAFIYVEDLAEGNVAALSPKAANRLYNLEGMEPVTILDIAKSVQQAIGDVQITFTDARPGDYVWKPISNVRAKTELGWEPKINLQGGIERYVAWVKQQKK